MSHGNPSPPVASQADWKAFNAEFPALIEQLQEARAFHGANPPDSRERGVYLFSEGDRPVYVGRTSVTARSRKAKKPPSTSFSARWEQHCGEKSAPNAASLAMKIAKELAAHLEIETPQDLKNKGVTESVPGWWKLRHDDPPPDFYLVFQAAKKFVRENLDFRFVVINDDERGVRSHVFEVYADVVLQTEYGDFSTS